MLLEPLTIQQCNWPMLIKIYGEHFSSPTRCLDDAGIKLDRPEAYRKSLSENFEGNTDEHIHFSFIGVSNLVLLITIQSYTNIKVLSKETETRDTYVFILTASLYEWKHGIINLQYGKKKNILEFCDRAISYLRMAGYRW